MNINIDTKKKFETKNISDTNMLHENNIPLNSFNNIPLNQLNNMPLNHLSLNNLSPYIDTSDKLNQILMVH